MCRFGQHDAKSKHSIPHAQIRGKCRKFERNFDIYLTHTHSFRAGAASLMQTAGLGRLRGLLLGALDGLRLLDGLGVDLFGGFDLLGILRWYSHPG